MLPGLDRRQATGSDLSDHPENAAGAVGVSASLGLLYAGLGWLSGMRDALLVVFEKPDREQPSFVVGKLRDLLTLVTIGVGADA